MSIRERAGVLVGVTVAVLMMGGFPLVAQEPAKPKAQVPVTATAPAEKETKKADPARRVPRHFGQVGLSNEQRASIYDIQGRRREKIQALEKQLAAERAEMLAECEAVLTPAQKQQLVDLRRVASTPKPAATPKPAEPAKPGS